MRRHAGSNWSLDDLARDTLLLTADRRLRPVASLSNPRIDTRHAGWGERPISERAIWEWDAVGLNQVRNLAVRHRMLNNHPVTVCGRVEWEPVTAVSIHGNRYQLPFTDAFLLSTYALEDYGYLPESSSGLWQIPANLHSSFQRIFGYEVHPKTGVVRPLARASLDHPELMRPYDNRKPFEPRVVKNGDVIDIVPLRFIVCIALGCAAERNDFEPAGVLGAAKLFPHTMVMANMPLESVEASIIVERPSSRAPDPDHPEACHMNGGELMHPNVSAGLYTDRNDSHVVPQLPTWDKIFDYYDTDPALNHAFKVVDAVKPRRERADAMNVCALQEDAGEFVMPLSILKVARQGEFDNLHLAPKMSAPPEVIAQHPNFAQSMSNIAMAPFCIHDCLHTHWRWGLTGFDRKYLRGWSGTAENVGDPHQIAGAPLVPPNQDVTITLLTPGSFRYSAKARHTQPSVWQPIMHHGSAYALSFEGQFARRLLKLPLRADLAGSLAMPWSVVYWNLRYDSVGERFVERVRLTKAKLSELRAL